MLAFYLKSLSFIVKCMYTSKQECKTCKFIIRSNKLNNLIKIANECAP